MDHVKAGDHVYVDTGGPPVDGVVFYLPSKSKAMVAVVDHDRGPGLRSRPLKALTERTGTALTTRRCVCSCVTPMPGGGGE
jgi:hypothetical protein